MRPYSHGLNLVAGTKTTMFTVPKQQLAKWTLLWAVNNTASAKNFSVWWYDKSTNTEIAVIESFPLASKTYLRFDGGAYVTLEEGDEIRVLAETGSTASALVTLEIEQAPTSQYHY